LSFARATDTITARLDGGRWTGTGGKANGWLGARDDDPLRGVLPGDPGEDPRDAGAHVELVPRVCS